MSTALWHQIFVELKEGIESGRYSPDSPLPSEADLAAKWNVSRLTAHRAFYELQRAGLVLRKRKVGTVVLPPKGSKPIRIAALFFHAGDHFQGNLLGSVRGGLSDNVNLSYVDTNRDAATEASALTRMSEEADGIILFPTCDPQNNELIRSLCNGGFPIVCIDRHPQGVPCDSVQSDNYAATYAALQAISEAGHSRIACFCDYEEPVSSTGDRVRAYRDLLEVVGGDQRADFHAFPYLAPDSTAEFRQMVDMVREALSVSFDGPHPPTAVFCSREHYAGAVIEACAELSISVPKDLTVLAFVDRPSYMLGLPESVQKIRQDISMMGQIAAERILRRVAGDPLEAERILVPALTSSPNGSSEEVVAASEAKASA